MQVEVAKLALCNSCRSSLDVRSYVDLAAYCHPWKMSGMQQWKYFALNFASLYFAFCDWNRATKSAWPLTADLHEPQWSMVRFWFHMWLYFSTMFANLHLGKEIARRPSRKSRKMRTFIARQIVFSCFFRLQIAEVCFVSHTTFPFSNS